MAITDDEVNEYRKIISQYWKVLERAFADDFGSESMWEDVVKQIDILAKAHNCNLSSQMAYVILDELDRTWKEKETLDKKIAYNVFLDCGNSLREARDWDRYNNLLHAMYGKYNGMRFAENMFDLMQKEVAKYITEQGENN